MKSPRSTSRMRAPLSASAYAMVPPPAPLPMMTTSKRSSGMDRCVDLVHQPLVHHGPFETHLRRPAVADGGNEIAIHRLIAADIAEARQQQPRQPAAPRQHEETVGFKRDDPLAAVKLGQAQPAQQRRDLPRIVES